MSTEVGAQLERLVGIMARLRAEGGCPWDREQDLRSLRPYLVEEAFEVLDEMDRVGYGGAWAPFCEELGDLLFQIVFHAQLATELKEFGMADVCRAIADKIERRHPHVFGEDVVKGSVQVLENWARLKADERKAKTGSEGSVLDGVPTAAPALLRAERLSEKASRIGFDWPDLAGVRAKLAEELAELDQAIVEGDRDALEHELGDVLFSVANLARFLQTPAEDALRQANRRFTSRFHHVEAGLRARGVAFGKATLEEMEALWVEAKGEEKVAPRARPIAARLRLEGASAEGAAFVEGLMSILQAEPARAHGRSWTVAGMEVELLASGARRSVSLCFTLPSSAALDLLAADLDKLAGKLRVVVERQPTALALTDPDGNLWRWEIERSG